MESFDFKAGDMVQVHKRFIGYIIYIDHKNDTADVEWEEYGECTSANIPLRYLEKVED